MPFEVPDRIRLAEPDPARMAVIRKRIAESATPVRPMRSNTALMLLCAGVFALLSVLFALPLGFPGFMAMSMNERWLDYPVIILLAMVLAGIVAQQMIPGTRRVMQPWAGVLTAILLLSLIAFVQFPDIETRDFLRSGIPCLTVGTLCAIPAGALTWTLMRRGFATDPVPAAIAGGAFSGLLGVAVLALHCPIFNAPHIIVWHIGVVAVTSLAGALIGWGAVRYGKSS
jgi:hypothetical protein